MKAFIILSLCSILLTACSSDTSTNVPPTPGPSSAMNPTPATATQPMTVKSYKESIDSIPKSLKDNQNFNACMNQSVNMCVSNGISSLAQEKKDISLCDDIQDNGFKSSCRQTVTLMSAREKKDPSICDNLGKESPDSIGACKSEVITAQAIESKDYRKCLEISALFPSQSPSGATGSAMMTGPGGNRGTMAESSCIFQIIMQTENADASLCDNIKDEAQKKMCGDSVRERARMRESMNNAASGMTIPAPSTTTGSAGATGSTSATGSAAPAAAGSTSATGVTTATGTTPRR